MASRSSEAVRLGPRRLRSDRVTDLPEYLSMRETTDYLNRHERTVRQMVADGVLPAYKLGREFRFRREDVEALFRPVPTVGDVD